MHAIFAARVPGIGQCQVIHRADAVNRLVPPKGTRQAGRWHAAAHWLCRGLRIATGARPPRLTRGAAGVSL